MKVTNKSNTDRFIFTDYYSTWFMGALGGNQALLLSKTEEKQCSDSYTSKCEKIIKYRERL